MHAARAGGRPERPGRTDAHVDPNRWAPSELMLATMESELWPTLQCGKLEGFWPVLMR
jgi:hypothetical protein